MIYFNQKMNSHENGRFFPSFFRNCIFQLALRFDSILMCGSTQSLEMSDMEHFFSIRDE